MYGFVWGCYFLKLLSILVQLGTKMLSVIALKDQILFFDDASEGLILLILLFWLFLKSEIEELLKGFRVFSKGVGEGAQVWTGTFL